MPNHEIRWGDLIPGLGLKNYMDRNFNDGMVGNSKSIIPEFTLIAYNSIIISALMLTVLNHYIK